MRIPAPCRGRRSGGAAESGDEIGSRRESAALRDGFEGESLIPEQGTGCGDALFCDGVVERAAGGGPESDFKGAPGHRQALGEFCDTEPDALRGMDEIEGPGDERGRSARTVLCWRAGRFPRV